MEASLPISAGLSSSRAATASTSVAARASSVRLPLAFMLTGLAALLLSVVWIAAQPSLLAAYHYNQFVIAATHLFVLGWIGSVVMGAMYQLVPVALETTLYSQRLAAVHYGCHLTGVCGMVWMFHAWNLKQVGHFGSLLAVGVGLFVYNIVRTVLRAPKWTVTASAVVAALAWFCLTVAVGLGIAAGKCSYTGLDGEPAANAGRGFIHGLEAIAAFARQFDAISAMHAHAHLGVVGFFTVLIVGVSYKLIPMFTLSEVRNPRRAALSVLFLNLGLAATIPAVLLKSSWKPVCAGVVILALSLYGLEINAIVRARKRRTLDWGVRIFLTAVMLLAPLSILAAVLSWPGLPMSVWTGRLENLYGFLGLAGMVSLALTGMLYKIIPFLVWFGIYSKRVGYFQVPALADLYSERLQKLGFGAWLAGLAIGSAAILSGAEAFVRLGALLLAVGVGALVLNVGKMLNHFFHPQVRPLPSSTTGIR